MAVYSAVQALRIGAEDLWEVEPLSLYFMDQLAVRPLAGETVLRSLESLEGIATIEGAVYASEADYANWRAIQIRGNAICDAYGVVLVLNRRTGQWHSIFNIESGCSNSLDYPFYGMRISDGHLIVSACIHCRGHDDDYAGFSINLETWRVQPLDAEDLSDWDPFYRTNPRIQDIEKAVALPEGKGLGAVKASVELPALGASDLCDADLIGADLTNAGLGSAQSLSQDQLDEACADPNRPPHLPPHLTWNGQPCA